MAAAVALEARLDATAGAGAAARGRRHAGAGAGAGARPASWPRPGLARLRDVGRYLEAVRLRLDKLGERPERDRDLMRRARALEAEFTEARAALPPERRGAPEVVEVRWLLEELRVSLFAQALGTARPVSEPRVRKALAALRAP